MSPPAVRLTVAYVTFRTDMNTQKEKIVFVAAHPDDTEGFAATAFLLRDKYELHVVDVTRGERGLGRPGLLDGTTGLRREAEELAACAMLGAKPRFLGEINGFAFAGGASVTYLGAVLADLRPVAVFTHWPVDKHAEHVQAAAVAANALLSLDYQPERYFFEVMFTQTRNYRPTYYVDVGATIESKLAMLRLYECQNANDFLAQDNLNRAKVRGKEAPRPMEFAETFTTFDGKPIPGGVIDSLPEAVVMPPNMPFFQA